MQNPVLPGASFARHWEALERSEERPRICLDRSDQQTDLSVFFCFLFLVFFVCFCFCFFCVFLFVFVFLIFPCPMLWLSEIS